MELQVFPKQLLLRMLPPEVDVLCTHPMFGPDSGKGSWAGLNFQYEKVRIGNDPRREKRVELFLKVRQGERGQGRGRRRERGQGPKVVRG